jgi:ATP adenylyltransferase
MAYIRQPKGGGCIFCDYPAAGRERFREHFILCADAKAFVILNRYPFTAGHVMIVPRRHVSDLADLPLDEHAALFELVRGAVAALREATGAEGINVGINLGAAAGAGIAEHLHVHVVPRWRGDYNFMPAVADVRVIPDALEATYDRLHGSFAHLDRRASRPAAQRPRRAGR